MMDVEDARAWLRGERSMTNIIMEVTDPSQRGHTLVLIAQADAAMCQQAYWVLRAALDCGFYEEDEPVEKIERAFEAGEHGVTGSSDD